MSDLQALGQHIRGCRLAAGMTQRDLADECGVDFTYISKIETGRMPSPPSRSLLVRLADCLGTDRDTLIDLADQRTKAELRAEIERLRVEAEGTDEMALSRMIQHLRNAYPDSVCLFRIGDYLEAYEQDAETLATLAGETVTLRDDVAVYRIPVARQQEMIDRLTAGSATVAVFE